MQQQLDAWLRARTPDELESLRDYAWDRLLSNRKVNVNGKQVSLKTLAEEVSRENEAFERGLLGEDQRSISRFEAQQQVPSRYLRRGSFKQILRKEEEEALELRRMGQGTNFSKQKPFGIIPFLPTRNFSYGICESVHERIHNRIMRSWLLLHVYHEFVKCWSVCKKCISKNITYLTPSPLVSFDLQSPAQREWKKFSERSGQVKAQKGP